ncbi:MAG TPA: 1-(5-phosphoribosyl)-5-[(5-phosphoribosylamino)methylideneamino]imidazole-4-carboxamide isomerase [Actinomycetota bacterium]|jgi:phosphoribosylformimino-5-aminoimidazole carboxamide ribotide isomerase|nr:1-(5-phosphoribosyl)-5-[(5-phosphoribosylamino)methylideneamino]imidazole-4-carboxamide isomerase [Actinomycetota bacterium]
MRFEVVPSVDILGGEVVRLRRGEPEAKTVYSDDPVAIAKDWEAQGAPRLHVVDLDAALEGKPQTGVVEQIVRGVGIPVQVAGGIRSSDAGRRWLGVGADRVIFGTAALTDVNVLQDAIESLGPRLVVAPDALGREVRIAGWTKGTGEDVVDAARRLAAAGVERLLVTDIGQDGTLAGPNVDLLRDVAEAAGVPVIASGGVATVEDVRKLASLDGIEGVIVGQALYSGAIELADAMREVA